MSYSDRRRRKSVLGARSNLPKKLLKRRGKYAFVDSLPPGAKVLDVGCGNDSPFAVKTHRPDCHYIGLDVGDYYQESDPREYADEYILTEPENFSAAIRRFEGQVDAVISSHNLEHCLAPGEVMDAMLKCLKPGGRIYLAFPCEDSVRFPRRRGTLNFLDDSTHRAVPNWQDTISKINREGMLIDFNAKRYREPILATIGLLFEPVSALTRRVMPAGVTWSLYGFESVIWASRPRGPLDND